MLPVFSHVSPTRNFYSFTQHTPILILCLQLRFVRGNERANIGRHIQQLQPLFFI